MKKFLTGLLISLFLTTSAFASFSNQTNKVFGTGDNTTVNFTYPFKVFKAADLQVYKIDANGTAHGPLTLNSDYTVTISTSSEGGHITFTVAPTATQTTLIERVEPLTQALSISTEGPLPSKQIENQLDLQMMVNIQNAEAIGRAIKFPATSQLTNFDFPNPSPNLAVGWDPTGTYLTNVSISGPAGPTGPQGVQGIQGAAATISVGSTTTGPAGGSASVSNSGTSGAAILNFTVPQGATGAQGPQGASGSGSGNVLASGTTSTGKVPLWGATDTLTDGTTTATSGNNVILQTDGTGKITVDTSGNAATATLATTATNVTTNANLTGGVTSVGNAATVVTNANLTGDVTSVGNATTLVKGVRNDGTVNPTQLLSGASGNFEYWSSGITSAPDGWLTGAGAIAREASTIKLGTYSAKLTRAGVNGALYQDIMKSYLIGRKVTFGCWVWCATGNSAALFIGDMATWGTGSSYHTGDSTWQWLSVTTTVGAGSHIYAVCEVNNNDVSAYFDGAMVVEGSSAFAYADMPLVYEYGIGTGGNQLVALNASAQLPAVDGSLLINLPVTSNVVFSFGLGKATTGTGIGWFSTPSSSGTGLSPAWCNNSSTYKTMIMSKFTKIAGQTYITVWALMDRDNSSNNDAYCNTIIGGVSGAIDIPYTSIGSGTPAWGSVIINVSSLTNGTTYDLTIQIKSQAGGGGNNGVYLYSVIGVAS